jgi:hypothetical protein
MMRHLFSFKFPLILALFVAFSCDDDNEAPGIRAKIDYSTLTPETPYDALFKDASGASTVDLTEGNELLQMFQAIDYYSSAAIAAQTKIDGAVMKNMFSNTGDPFFDINTSTRSISGEKLNNSPFQLRSTVASSLGDDAEGPRQQIEIFFSLLASQPLSQTASPGVGGMLDNYLVDNKGIEVRQLIQKYLIGALQLDYIGNVLLDEGLTADNSKLVGDHNYTQLEHNWDVAYGLLTLNPIYLEGSTDEQRNTVEFAAGSYIWEYNKANYAAIYPAFLKGRAAIVNNDREQYQALATFIRTEFEKTIAQAALGYLAKWKSETTDAKRAHAIGEGIGFIYALQFAELHQADANFTNGVAQALIGSGDGFWDLDAEKINAASDAIREKFDL